ncbi:MAG: c-type cytochrome [Gemmataceae bacterium]|nr:c-type cytochrome [Gemmataceae bacterium]
MSVTTSLEATQANPPSAPATGPGLSRLKTMVLFATPLLLLGYMLIGGWIVYSGAKYERQAPEVHPETVNVEPNGLSLYLQNCARCHGDRGKADGITSGHLNPWARKFGEEKFQLSTTTNGVPCDEDLHHAIKNGIPGTGMPAFEQLTEAERRAIIQHVRHLTWAGAFRRRLKQDEDDGDVNIPEIIKAIEKQVTPGPRKEVPSDFPTADADSLARGQKIFGANCATCHGPKGAGDGPQVKGMKNDSPQNGGNGLPTHPRDLARGVYKGGGDRDRLYQRLALGMPGTPMPASATLKPNEIGDLVNFVQYLAKPSTNANP